MSATDDEFQTFDNEFYPTGPTLARRALKKFNEQRIERLLEPQAGRGDILDVMKDMDRFRYRMPTIECIEIDLANQAILRAKGYRVVGSDFLTYRGASLYSHIVMNPPFSSGARHVLRAWDLLFSGEIVAIINAQSIRNPRSAEKKLLCTLIHDHGSVEFVQEAFMSADTKRKAVVEVALVHLEKRSSEYTSFFDGLRKDVEQRMAPAPESPHELIVPRNFIENLCINFACASEAAKQACVAEARANHYAGRFDRSIAELGDEENFGGKVDLFVAKSFNERYDKLKEQAWSTVLRSTAALEKLSSTAQKRVEASFKELCSLEFSYENIWGFLNGLIAQQSQIQIDMVCDVFDAISRHHSENRAYYQGWKSNDKHRLNAFRVKMTRFILPRCSSTWGGKLSWDDEQRFRDFDKVFAMLDGKKPETVLGIEKLFATELDALRAGERKSAEYFDVRYYPKVGSFHVFPRRKDLIDRMNRVVGQHRQWLPHDKSAAPAAFWEQYERAEKVTALMPDFGREEWWAFGMRDETERCVVEARDKMTAAHQAAMAQLGINYEYSMLLTHEAAQRATVPALPFCDSATAAA